MVIVGTDKGTFYIDGYLKSNLDILKEAVRKDFDGCLYIIGEEGSGKSTLGFQIATYLMPTFSLDWICWTPQQFMQLVNRAPKGAAIVLDEAYMTFS